MAVTTIFTFLMQGSGQSATKLVDIKSYPDLGSAPDTLDATTMSNFMRVYEKGLQDPGSLEFTANYNPTDYAALEKLDDGTDHDFSVWFGGTKSGTTVTPTGDLGEFAFSGKLGVYVSSADVNAIAEMTITIVPSTEIVFSATPATI